MECKTIRLNAISTAGRFRDDIHCVLPFSLALHGYLCNLVSHSVIEHILISRELRIRSPSTICSGSFTDEAVPPILIHVHKTTRQLMPINLWEQRLSAYRARTYMESFPG